ncbi:MAG: hypothetical protein EBU39_02910, partial [Proteobacteria bacterium]|nr:hypothetical protein [Pseudomonadota bacterium]
NMGIIYSASPVFIILFSFFLFKEKITFYQVVATIVCIFGVFIVLSKGKIDYLLELKFTTGDIWISGAMLSWAVYSVYLMNFKSNFDLLTRFVLTIIASVPFSAPMVPPDTGASKKNAFFFFKALPISKAVF